MPAPASASWQGVGLREQMFWVPAPSHATELGLSSASLGRRNLLRMVTRTSWVAAPPSMLDLSPASQQQNIPQNTPGSIYLSLQVMELDLSSLASVRRFAEAWRRRGLPLHVLINNAGIFSMSGGCMSSFMRA